MNNRMRGRSRAVIVVGAALVVWSGCRDENPLDDEGNRPPETYIVQSPGWGESSFYINHIFWEGYDPDGRVDYFEVTVTDSFGIVEDDVEWHPTFRTDSLVRFPVGGENGQSQVLGNRFYVRAVDNLGRRDLDPAWIFFGARDARYPEVVFKRADGESDEFPQFGRVSMGVPTFCDRGVPADTLPTGADATFIWTGVDRDSIFGSEVGSISAFEYKLSGVNNQFVGGTLRDTIALYEDLAPGVYTFTVRTTDDGGLTSEGCRYFQVNYDPTVNIQRVWNSCDQDSVIAARIATRQWANDDDPCGGVEPWSYTDVLLPDPPVNPCLPPGYIALNDTLRVSPNQATGWWFEFDVDAFDPDGDVERLEINVMECSSLTGNCSPRAWDCAALDGETSVVGPFTSGDWRVVIAAVDELGQRGASSADTINFRVDLKPQIVTVTDGIDMDVCDGLAAGVGDTIQVCGSDTLYIVSTVQGSQNNDAPCAVQTVYAETGTPAPLTVADYNSFPRDGDTLALEFQTDGQGRRFARFCGLAWGRDPDGTHRIGYARWSVDQVPTGAWGTVDPVTGTALPDPNTLTPVCFCPIVRQSAPEADHTLYVEFRDWLQTDAPAGVRVAQRTVRQVISFTVQDVSAIADRRYTLPGRDER